MVDGIDANRNKWQDLCSSYHQTRRASVSSQSAESDQSPDFHEDAESNQHTDARETLKPVENTKYGSKSKCSYGVRCIVNRGSCDDKPASAGNITAAGKK